MRPIAEVHTNPEAVIGSGATRQRRLSSMAEVWRAAIERASLHYIDVLENVGHPAWLPVVGRPDNHRPIKTLIDGFA